MEGTILDSRYELTRLVGTGGMSEVWLAWDQRLERWVAVKLLGAQHFASGDVPRAILDEARTLAGLHHQGIVSVFDAGAFGEQSYLVMEYVNGYSMRDLLDARGTLTVAEAVRYGRQVAAALQYTHESNLVHRDVKPENILIDEKGVAKVTDFGIAEAVSRTLTATEAREVLGTVAYLAPEVLRGEPATPRSDVYSLALLIYEALAGRLPFSGSTAAAAAAQRLVAPPPPVRTFAPGTPAAIEAALATALAIDPRDRFRSAAEFGNAIRDAARGGAAAPAPATRATGPVPAFSGAPPRRRTRHAAAAAPVVTERRRGGGPWLAVIAGLLLALAGIGVGVAAIVVLMDDDDGGDPSPDATATPTSEPTGTATEAPEPTEEPTAAPTQAPTEEPTAPPTEAPTEEPTETPTEEPTETPTEEPTETPTEEPTEEPTATPTEEPASPVPPGDDVPPDEVANEQGAGPDGEGPPGRRGR